MLTLTDAAVKHLHSLVEEKGEPGKALRIFIERGGCAGMSYGMTLDDPQPADYAAERDGVKVIVDPDSLQYLEGSTIDYCDDLAGTGFRINNPKASRSCGCGTSFEPAGNDQHA
jgi:iron-sulfur cluster assembly accessory protein